MKEKEVFIYCNVTKLNLFLSFHHKMHNIRLLDKKRGICDTAKSDHLYYLNEIVRVYFT